MKSIYNIYRLSVYITHFIIKNKISKNLIKLLNCFMTNLHFQIVKVSQQIFIVDIFTIFLY